MKLQSLCLYLFVAVIESLNVLNNKVNNGGAYIHIPFCRRKCFYCNFPVVVVGERKSTQQSQGELYTSLLLREIKKTLKDTHEPLCELETVYFGGGTPSLLPVDCKLFLL